MLNLQKLSIKEMMRAVLFLLTTVLLLASCTTSTLNQLQKTAYASRIPKQFTARQILVTLAAKDKSRWPALEQELLRDYPVIRSGAFPLNTLGIRCLVFIVPKQINLSKLIIKLSNDARVETVQENTVFINQRNQHSDQYAQLQYGIQQIGADKVHHKFTGKGIKVAIIDTGIDTQHPDLINQVILQKNFIDKGDESFALDRHGTAIAGIIAAIADNDIGIYGIAPEAQLLGLKSCFYQARSREYAVCSSWSLAKALDFAILENVNIINLSLSGPQDNLLTRIILEGQKQKIIFVAATNDRNHKIGFPASLPNVIAVASSENAEDDVFSPIKNKNILFAPGKEILSTAPRNKYDFYSGSSLAAAIVSGSIALLKEKNPNISTSEIIQLLRNPKSINICHALMVSC